MTKHTFELASSGRSKCRGCGAQIAKDSLRFGERVENPFGEEDATHWHHPQCAAHRRPESLAEALADLTYDGDDRTTIVVDCTRALANPRLQRLGVAERAASARARCRHCKEAIDGQTWRLPLVFFDEGMYSKSGFIHACCVKSYCGTDEVWPTVACYAVALESSELDDLEAVVASSVINKPAEE